MRKGIVLFLMLLLTVSSIGCSKEKTDTTNVTEETVDGKDDITTEKIGYYKEIEVDLTEENPIENMTDIAINSEGELEYYTRTQDTKDNIVNRYIVKDGKLQKQSVEWAIKASHDIVGMVSEFRMGADGQYFLVLQEFTTINPESKDPQIFVTSRIFRDAGNGNDYVEITPKNWNQIGEGTKAISVDISRDGTIVYSDYGDLTLHAYSMKDQKELDFTEINKNITSGGGWVNPYIKENCIYYFDKSNRNILSLDLITKEEKSIPCDLDLEDALMCISGDIYVANKDGIHCFRSNGTTWETLVSSDDKQIGSSNNKLRSFTIKDGEYKDFYVGLNNTTSNNHAIINYQYCNEPIPVVADQLIVYSLKENLSMRNAITKYQMENPQVQIDYVVAMSEDLEANEQDVLRSLSTELLAGKGPDILVLDDLPVKQYIENGALLELSDLLCPMINDGTLLSNIANNYVSEGEVYAMPMRYLFPYYVLKEGTQANMESVKAISELADNLQSTVYQSGSYEDLLLLMVTTYYDDFMIGQEQMDQNQFRDFLMDVKNISNHMTITEDPPLYYYVDTLQTEEKNYQNWCIYRNNSCDLFEFDFYAATGFADEFKDFNYPYSLFKKMKGNLVTMDGTFIPSGMVGINKSTKSEEATKEFMKYLFSDKVQASQNLDGFPVNAHSLETWSNMETAEGDYQLGSYNDVEIYRVTEQERQEAKKIMQEVSKPVFNNQIVLHMIINESLGYLTGEKNLDQAVNDTINKVNLYLFEQ